METHTDDQTQTCISGVGRIARSLMWWAVSGRHRRVAKVLINLGTRLNVPLERGNSYLIEALLSGQTQLVKTLIRGGADIDAKEDDGVSALAVASREGYTDIVNILVDKGAQTEARDNDGRTPLWLAAANGQTDVVRALVSAGADANTQRNDGSSALGFASLEGHIDIVKMLLDNGAQIERRDNDGRTPLWDAAANGQIDVVRALVSAGAEVNTQRNYGVSALSFASYKGYTDIVKVLLNSGTQIETRDDDGRTPLWLAAADGQTDVVRALVSAGADVNAQRNDGVSALSFASQEGYIDVVNMLLDNGAQIETRDNDGHTPLWFAAVKGQTDVVRALVSGGADVNARNDRGFSPLCIACQEERRDTVIMLLDFGAQTNNSGFTPLTAAAQAGHVDIVKALVQHGTVMDIMQPLDQARSHGHTEIVEFLSSCSSPAITPLTTTPTSNVGVDCRCNNAIHLTSDLQAMRSLVENGADVEAENVDGLRPIHCAVRTRRVELVELLIRHGANVDAADQYGNRPLHEAVCHGLNVVQSLVQRGAKLNVQNIDGKTPLHVAIERQQSEVIMFLLNEGADIGLTDVWRNTPLHYVTHELLAVSGVAENLANLLSEKGLHMLTIPNSVGVSTLTHITAHGLLNYPYLEMTISTTGSIVNASTLCSKYTTTQAHNQKSSINLCSSQHAAVSKPTYDCQGNTPLHYAVGVYGKLNMFKVSNDTTQTVEFLVKAGIDINAQNNDGLTALHVARGQQAIKACIQYADDKSFAITDERGRNFWHLLFITKTQNKAELATIIRSKIVISDDKYNVDDLNRTPLHYCCMDRNPWIAWWSWLAEEFIETFGDELINKQDNFGRTALHYAAIGDNNELKEMLEAKNGDPAIRDNYHRTSSEYAEIRSTFDTQVSLLRLMRSSNIIGRQHRTMLLCVQKCFADTVPAVEVCKAELRQTVRNLTGFHDTASYVLNIWRGCRLNYSRINVPDITQRKPMVHDQVDQRLREQEDITGSNGKSATEPTDMFAAIQTKVHNAMEVLAEEITARDRRFACEIIPVGSSYEVTKIGCCDEFDYNFVFTNLSSICEVCYSPESPPGFVLLKASVSEYDKGMEDLFDQNGIFDTRMVKLTFEFLAKRILSSASFCERTDFEFIDPFPLEDLGIPQGNVSTKLNTRIKLIFMKPVNDCHVLHTISVDVVPALQINDWWPDDARKQELCQTGDCLIVLSQPQVKHPWVSWTEPHGLASFAKAESRLLRECPPVAKAAYMVVKRMSKYFCEYDFFPSHAIKTALLWCLDEKEFTKYRSSRCSKEVNEDELLRLVQSILRRLLCFAAQDYVPSYFMPKCHLPVWLKEGHLQQFHSRLHQHGLTHKDLFSLSEQLSHDPLLQDIRSMFVFSHFMYWIVLSDTDELKLFVPSTINPLCEVTYDSDE